MKLISIVTPCFNEEDNVEDVYTQVREVFAGLNYAYEHIFIDNASTDETVSKLKAIAAEDQNVKIIVNTRNFGWVCSPHYALLQAQGEAVVLLCADLQDPPLLIRDFIQKWEEGYKVVLGIKTQSEEPALMYRIRTLYYNFVNKISQIELNINNTGFGLYDRRVLDIMREIDDPYPYFRGLVPEIGFKSAKIEYVQPVRKKGVTSSNLYMLYDMAMLGITNHSKIPLRAATMLGFLTSALSLCVAFVYFIAKLVYWQQFSLGTAPLIIGLFFFGSLQLFFIGILGEYIGAIYTQVRKRALVIEKERINF